ncbi:GntR family transcriptional regulator [Granulicella arctica]|uniref:GntR family transcriptional regulator n=1 Tax=Granulicella arctica TaxID=940613 RepID=UPI0021DFC97C|nr:substrate-binding domain-containing protein [Granulicella arctica]
MKSKRHTQASVTDRQRKPKADPTSGGSPLEIPKYRQVYDDLLSSIKAGTFRPGDRLPSEAELGKRYETSRITVAKAVNELQLRGLVSRRAGSGTHVLAPARSSGHLFGLLIPDLGKTEIFEPVCHGMMQSPLAKAHSLLWGHAMGDAALQEREAEQLAHRYVEQKVSGVFFAPLEFTPARDAVNQRIVAVLDRANIAIVLLDRCYAPYPTRSKYDLVGIDNRRTGFLITQHLLRLGLRRIAFLAKPLSATTVAARISGYREALLAYGIDNREDLVRRGDPDDPKFIDDMLQSCKPEGIVCANDWTAAHLMTHLAAKGIRVPEDMRVVGIDDVKYAAMLPTPLTTEHQNCGNIGAAALSAMLDRVENPLLPTRDILLQTQTVVRRSCGAHLLSGRGTASSLSA